MQNLHDIQAMCVAERHVRDSNAPVVWVYCGPRMMPSVRQLAQMIDPTCLVIIEADVA